MPRLLAVILLLLIGLATWLALDFGGGERMWHVAVAVAAGLAAAGIPPLRRMLARGSDRIRHPTPRQLPLIALGVALVASGYLTATALRQHRDLYPRSHDECSYAIQTQMLARGHLWMPPHELGDFFDSFHLLVRPVYASIYFPGTALLYVPTVWLGLPFWVMPVLTAGAVVGLIYWLITELIDGVAGALAALFLLSLTIFRMLSVSLHSQLPMMFLGLAMLLCWTRWRRDGRFAVAWAAAVGALAGWSAITRPLDALCFAIPVGLAMTIELWRLRAPARRWLFTLLVLALPAAPFLALQALHNWGTTGSWRRFATDVWVEHHYPAPMMGFRAYDPATIPRPAQPQQRALLDDFVRPAYELHRRESIVHAWTQRRLPGLLRMTLPHTILVVLLPVGLLCLRSPPRWVLFATLPLFIAGYACYVFFLAHYAAVVAPAVILLVLLGTAAAARILPDEGPRAVASVGLATFIAALCVTALPEVDPDIQDQFYVTPTIKLVHEQLPAMVQKPAVVLVRFARGNNPHEEPVYNTDVAWPDDAPIVLAHDLGPDRDPEIFEYYARRQPERAFYLYDRRDDTIAFLGIARDLAAQRE